MLPEIACYDSGEAPAGAAAGIIVRRRAPGRYDRREHGGQRPRGLSSGGLFARRRRTESIPRDCVRPASKSLENEQDEDERDFIGARARRLSQVEEALMVARIFPFRAARRLETGEPFGISDRPLWSNSSKTRLAAPRAHTSSPQLWITISRFLFNGGITIC